MGVDDDGVLDGLHCCGRDPINISSADDTDGHRYDHTLDGMIGVGSKHRLVKDRIGKYSMMSNRRLETAFIDPCKVKNQGQRLLHQFLGDVYVGTFGAARHPLLLQ